MKLLILVPDPAYPEPFAWAFHVEAEALRAAGAEVTARPWTAPGDLTPFDCVLPLVVWGYHLQYGEWLALLDRLEEARAPVLNPVPLLRWNSDKAYLEELGDKGIPTVPTHAVKALDEAELAAARERFGVDRLIIKPPVSAAADGTVALDPGDPLPEWARGKAMMVQPFISSITSLGEYSLVLFDGQPSHCVVKRPAAGDFRVQPHLGGMTEACDPPPGAVQLARDALAAAPAPATYARVDMVADDAGALQVIELELIEPALFLHCASSAGQAFGEAVVRATTSLRAERSNPLPQR